MLKAGALTLLAIMSSACSRGPQPIRAGFDVAECGMIISDPRFAAEAVGRRHVRKYDSLDSLRGDRDRNRSASLYVADFGSGNLLRADRATVLQSPKIEAPMDAHAIAFGSPGKAMAFARRQHLGHFEIYPFTAWYRLERGSDGR
ncbi:MAG: hypothetical protein KGR26_05335 [Cyanobacteria bacterium REEB65]|nr:hypothetical protein [Cyanobacteria bacterium REEB65]